MSRHRTKVLSNAERVARSRARTSRRLAAQQTPRADTEWDGGDVIEAIHRRLMEAGTGGRLTWVGGRVVAADGGPPRISVDTAGEDGMI